MAPRVKRTPELAKTLCQRIAKGESLLKICREERMPSRDFVYDWLREDTEFRDMYVRAREDQAETMLEEILAIADDAKRDTRIERDKQGREIEVSDNEWIQRSKLRVDARKWAMSKLAPKKYGDKIGVEHSGSVELAGALEAARKRVSCGSDES